MTKAIMLQGTGSDVGKTVLVAGLCRAARNRGLIVRPFKPQNMSNNAAVSDDGGEMGRAQWLQALACGVPPSVHMNPILLKPQTDTGSQIIIQGQVRGQAQGRDYQNLKPDLLNYVMESWRITCDGADIVIVEGAGSPAEINLRDGDIANMGFAIKANVPVVLVGDIDRGGVIASLVGTHVILPPEDREMIAGFLINKFRGDVSLFDDGLAAITDYTGWPSFGVIPWLKSVAQLPAEDSIVLERFNKSSSKTLKIAVPMLSRIANFDDFDPLKAEPDVELVMVAPGQSIPSDARLIIIPGTKSTIADLHFLRSQGWDKDIAAHVHKGGYLMGICGGYQMLGKKIADPLNIEGQINGQDQIVKALGYLDIETIMESRKTIGNVDAVISSTGEQVKAYEIHVGHSTGPDTQRPFSTLINLTRATSNSERQDGAVSANGRVCGTYLHGLFANDAYRRNFLHSFGAKASSLDYLTMIDAALDMLANELEACIDIDALLEIASRR